MPCFYIHFSVVNCEYGVRYLHLLEELSSRGHFFSEEQLPLCPPRLSSFIFHGRKGRWASAVHVQTNPVFFLITATSQMTWLQHQPIILDNLLVCSRMWCCQCCLSRPSPCTACQGHWKTMPRITEQIYGSTIHFFEYRQHVTWWW